MFKPDDKIKFKGENRPYHVQACDSRYLICTKPFNLKKSVLYTIVDFKENIRGTENLVFCMGFETRKLCKEALKRLQSGYSEISYRNRIRLDIERVWRY